MVSAGLGGGAAAQTYLDIGQGNRVNADLYDGELPRLRVVGGRVPPDLWHQSSPGRPTRRPSSSRACSARRSRTHGIAVPRRPTPASRR